MASGSEDSRRGVEAQVVQLSENASFEYSPALMALEDSRSVEWVEDSKSPPRDSRSDTRTAVVALGVHRSNGKWQV